MCCYCCCCCCCCCCCVCVCVRVQQLLLYSHAGVGSFRAQGKGGGGGRRHQKGFSLSPFCFSLLLFFIHSPRFVFFLIHFYFHSSSHSPSMLFGSEENKVIKSIFFPCNTKKNKGQMQETNSFYFIYLFIYLFILFYFFFSMPTFRCDNIRGSYNIWF